VAEPPCRVLASYLIDSKDLSCLGNPDTTNPMVVSKYFTPDEIFSRRVKGKENL
jgi:hypothetical protein